jgi:2-iminobutanoate/2-iminopropanoate deaminase
MEKKLVKEEIKAAAVPTPTRCFSRGIAVTNPKKFIFISGAGSYKGGGIKEQSLEVFRNLDALLKEAGASWDNVVHTLTFLRDMKRDFKGFDQARTEFFKEAGVKPPYPASTGVEAKMIDAPGIEPPECFLLEMEVTAVIA